MVVLYTKEGCGPCTLVENEFNKRGMVKGTDWIERNISTNTSAMDELVRLGYKSVPVAVRDNQVLFNGFRPDIMAQVL